MDLQEDNAINHFQGHSITYRIAVGPQQGHKVFTLQTILSWEDDFDNNQVGKIAGLSLHAGVATKTRERKKLERLRRYIARPAVSVKRLALTSHGKVRYALKTPYRDGASISSIKAPAHHNLLATSFACRKKPPLHHTKSTRYAHGAGSPGLLPAIDNSACG
ncbi:MAG: hypothetical protein ACI9GB_003108 [Halioglobus sp.]